MSLKYKILLSAFSLITAFAFGRYSVNQPQVKFQETAKTEVQLHENKDTHSTTTTTTIKALSGEEKITSVTTTDTTTKLVEDKDTEVKIKETITPQKKNTLNLSVLVTEDLHNITPPIYGISVTKEFIGPITLGVFGLTNGTIGISAGLNF